MIANTTKLNKPGKALSEMAGVHALTDVTGFGLLGHLLELARGAKLDCAARPWRRFRCCRASSNWRTTVTSPAPPAATGMPTARMYDLSPATVKQAQHMLLTDPQTSGGLLVCVRRRPAWTRCWSLFRREGFGEAAVIGKMAAGAAQVTVD